MYVFSVKNQELIICVFVNQGLNLCIPVIDSIKYVQSLKEIAIDIPQQSAITAGNWRFIKLYLQV